MLSSLNSREKRIGLIAAIALGLLALDRVLLSPLLTRWSEAGATLKAARSELDAARQTLTNDQHAQGVWDQMKGDTLKNNASDSESQLLNATRNWADVSRLSLQSLKPERSEKERGFQKITVRAAAVGTMQQVARFLSQVQSASIPVRISDVQITSRKENTDDLSVVIGLSTILLADEPAGMEAKR
ncbi:MAG: type 4a pilus biogenesis protein PilO [Phycisphaerales bacterium]|nr:type 4a pilus biogenesis protein PilO [Phycisphaerales bacterium]